MEPREITVLIAVVILVSLVALIVALFVVFVKRKNELLEEKEKIALELSNAQVEIREATLRNISWELHDNIGQLMTLAKINAQLIENDPSKVKDVSSTISKALTELRSLSKSINPEFIKSLSLIQAIELEIERFNRLGHISSTLVVEGNVKTIDQKKEIILFRILQEFFTNTIKHSKGNALRVLVHYKASNLLIRAQDNGQGFMLNEKPNGLGLLNMKNRAKVIDANLEISSQLNVGTELKLELKY